MNQVRGRGAPVLLVDGGDAFFGTPTRKAPPPTRRASDLRKAKLIVEAYNLLGYDAVGIGPGDYQYGVETLRGILASARFPVVCANLIDAQSGKPVFAPYAVVKAGGVRFGIYGVTLDSVNPRYAERVLGERYRLLDAVEATRRVVAELKPQVDVVIGLSHLNSDDNEKIASEIPGIDVLVDPYSRSGNKAVWITNGEYLTQVGPVSIVRIDGQGSRVGVFEMTFPDGKRTYTRYKCYDYPLEPQIFDHPEMVRLRRFFSSGLWKGPTPGFQPGRPSPMPDLFLGDEACGACHDKQYEFWKQSAHSRAFASLEKTNDHTRADCIECHTSGYGVGFVSVREADRFKNVQCEACHGVNPDHPVDPSRHRMGKVQDTRCWGCHNPQVTHKAFFFDEAYKKAACPRMEN